MHLTLAAIAKFSVRMLWVVGFLFVADFAAIILLVVRTGKVDQDEGRVATTGGGGNLLGAWGKEKILVHRSEFISGESLVDGTATKSQRLLVHCFWLAFFLFWLLFVFIGLSLLPAQPIRGAFFVIVPSIGFFRAAVGMHKGHTDALRKLQARVARRKARQKT